MAVLGFIFGLASLLLQGYCQEFTFETGVTYERTKANPGNWSVDGTIRLTETDLILFEPMLEIQTIQTKCTIDLQQCPVSYQPQSEDFCYCQARNNDEFSIHVGSKATPDQSGLKLQAVVPSKKVFQPVGAHSIIGKIPQISETLPLTDVCLNGKSGSSNLLVTRSDGQQVLCDTKTDGHKWTIVQRRIFGNVDFFRNWQDYVDGFGDFSGDFWFGLENIHSLCHKVVCEARFEMKFKGKDYYAKYRTFLLLGKEDKYRLFISGYSGDAGNMMESHNEQQFSTKDNDNDSLENGGCAEYHRGAWWYWHCHHANLNGEWGNAEYGDGLNWKNLTGYHDSVTYSVIKVRPRI